MKAVLILGVASLTALAGVASCQRHKHAAPSETAAVVTYAKDVKPLVDARCAGCHADGQVAFPLTSFESVSEKRSAVVAAVFARRMPVWLAAAGHQAYHDDPTLTPDEVAVFERWQDGGFARGEEAAAPQPGSAMLRDLDADLVVPMFPDGVGYLPDQTRNDEYRCFVMSWPYATDRKYVTGLQAVPGNRRVVHHLVAYHLDAAVTPMVQALDAEEAGQGYRCFGGALPDRLYDPEVRARMNAAFPGVLGSKQALGNWLGHWAPGMRGFDLPPGTGIAVEPGGVLIVQVHYYAATAPGEADGASEVRLKIADRVEEPGFVLQLTNNEWLDAHENRSMVVPPGAEATFSFASTMQEIGEEGQYVQHSDAPVERVTIYTSNLHMHSYGKSSSTYLTTADGAKTTLLEIPRWNLAWQRDYTFVEPKTFTGEQLAETSLAVECTYENRTDHEVFGGFSSDEEMCFNFAFVTVNGRGK